MICVGLEFENSKYEFPSPDPYRQKEMLLGWVWGFLKVLSKTKSASKKRRQKRAEERERKWDL